MEIKFKPAEIDPEDFAKVTIMEVPLVDELMQDCFYNSMDAPSELKLLILEQVSKAFDKYVLDNSPEDEDKNNLKEKLDKIKVSYKKETL